MAKLIEIKDFNPHWYNNLDPKSFTLPHSSEPKYGKRLKTPMAVDCMDNKRRRVYIDNNQFSYVLYVFIGGEKTILCDPVYHSPVSWFQVDELITTKEV